MRLIKIIKNIFILPVLPLAILYALVSIYLFYKNDGAEFEIILEKDELSEHLKG